jgi:hypothetical protein
MLSKIEVISLNNINEIAIRGTWCEVMVVSSSFAILKRMTISLLFILRVNDLATISY